jgi:hypothetical protein
LKRDIHQYEGEEGAAMSLARLARDRFWIRGNLVMGTCSTGRVGSALTIR